MRDLVKRLVESGRQPFVNWHGTLAVEAAIYEKGQVAVARTKEWRGPSSPSPTCG
jgi:hypothetical protein